MAGPFDAGGSGPFGGGGGGAFGGGGGLIGPGKGGKIKRAAGGPIGFVEHLGGDIENALVQGIPHAVETLGKEGYNVATFKYARNPKKGKESPLYQDVTGAAKAAAQTYAPLVHGNFGEFAHRFYEHPFGPIQDALTLLGFTAAGLERAGLATIPREVSLTAPSGETLTRPLTGSALRRATTTGVYKGFDRAAKRVGKVRGIAPAEVKIIGEFARYGRELRYEPLRTSLGRKLIQPFSDYLAAWGKLTADERVATRLLGEVPLEETRQAWLAKLRDSSTTRLHEQIDKPSVVEKFLNPTAGMQEALKVADALGAEHANLLGHEPGVVEQRRYLPTLLAHGVDLADEQAVTSAISSTRERLAAAGRPEPVYFPHTAVETGRGTRVPSAGAGQGPPRKHGAQHKNEGVLFLAGQLALDPDALGPSWLRAVKLAHANDIHAGLMRAAVEHTSLPAGWQWVRKNPRERILYTTKTRGEFDRNLAEQIPNPEAETHHGLDLTTSDIGDAEQGAGGGHLAVPTSLAREAAGEFASANRTARWLLQKPTQVWRALVLNARVGWLTGNIVGNHFLYAIRNAGPAGLHAYLNAVLNAKGPAAVRRMLGIRDPNGVGQAFMRELFPEQTSAGTFIGSQRPTGIAKRAAPLRKAAGSIAAADRASEAALRRAAVEAELRRSPEVRARLREMPKETRRFEHAARQALQDDPKLARRVSEKVNDALGNFLDLSETQRGTVRAIAPFWAWYRAITKIAVKLPLDMPARAAILARLGQIADEQSNEQLGPLPSYLRGAVGLGGDTIFRTQGLNPFSTVAGVGAAAGALLPGSGARSYNALLGMINPYIAGAGTTLVKVGSGDYKASLGLPLEVGKKMVNGLPQTRLAEALLTGHGPKSKLYENTQREELLRYLGVPITEFNRYEAAKQAAAGR